MTLEEARTDLIDLFVKTDNREEMEKLFQDLFTNAEIKDFTLRWKLMDDLYCHIPQRKIASDLGISLCKITRGSKMLKKEDGYARKILSARHDDHLHI